MQKLTTEFVEALVADGKDRTFFDTALSGFGVRVTPAGTKVFIARAQVAGKPRKVGGRHLSLHDSRGCPARSPRSARRYPARCRSRQGQGRSAQGD